MSSLELKHRGSLERVGVKGPAAARWLAEQGIAVPAAPNTWTGLPDGDFLAARLGTGEFFLEGSTGGCGVPVVGRTMPRCARASV
jgi:sarcosine oxidase subunit gamma